jgi:hypothetical protein
MNKGIVPVLAILGILVVAVGAPALAIAVDKISGKDIVQTFYELINTRQYPANTCQ